MSDKKIDVCNFVYVRLVIIDVRNFVYMRLVISDKKIDRHCLRSTLCGMFIWRVLRKDKLAASFLPPWETLRNTISSSLAFCYCFIW